MRFAVRHLALVWFATACVAGWGATTQLLSLTTFQYPEGIPGVTWGYRYASPFVPEGTVQNFTTYWYDEFNDPEITNYMGQFSFDSSVFEDFLATNAGASFGEGFGGYLNLTNEGGVFTSGSRADYIYSFDVRVGGLLPGVTSATGDMQIRFEAEDNTLQPQDANTDPDLLLQVNRSFTASSNWTHQSFILSQGSLGSGTSDAVFAAYHTNVNNLQFGCNWHMPAGKFGFDGDNAVYIDNLKVELIVR